MECLIFLFLSPSIQNLISFFIPQKKKNKTKKNPLNSKSLYILFPSLKSCEIQRSPWPTTSPGPTTPFDDPYSGDTPSAPTKLRLHLPLSVHSFLRNLEDHCDLPSDPLPNIPSNDRHSGDAPSATRKPRLPLFSDFETQRFRIAPLSKWSRGEGGGVCGQPSLWPTQYINEWEEKTSSWSKWSTINC